MSAEPRSIRYSDCPIPMSDTRQVLLGHGSGGKLTAQLIEGLILPAFRNSVLERLDDQAQLDIDGGRLAFTTDSYVITPIFFPGGDIGELAVNGTINDLAVGGARPLALSLALILEEGFPLADLERVIASARAAAEGVGVPVVTGDTKVVPRGKGDGLFVNTSGIGMVPRGLHLSSERVVPGDAILVSGTMGDHGIAILSCRAGLEFEGALASDTAPLHDLVTAILASGAEVHAMRDPTRGGLTATLVEIASRRTLGIDIDEYRVPVRESVRGVCELLGLDPLMVANEGKLVAFVAEKDVDRALAAMRAHPLGADSAWIGRVTVDHQGMVVGRTSIGGERIIDLPYTEQLPRIC
jgi:hydrogenase expression/formation protein HypE